MRRGAPASLVIAGGGGGEMLLKISSKLRLSTTPSETSRDSQKQAKKQMYLFATYNYKYLIRRGKAVEVYNSHLLKHCIKEPTCLCSYAELLKIRPHNMPVSFTNRHTVLLIQLYSQTQPRLTFSNLKYTATKYITIRFPPHNFKKTDKSQYCIFRHSQSLRTLWRRWSGDLYTMLC